MFCVEYISISDLFDHQISVSVENSCIVWAQLMIHYFHNRVPQAFWSRSSFSVFQLYGNCPKLGLSILNAYTEESHAVKNVAVNQRR